MSIHLISGEILNSLRRSDFDELFISSGSDSDSSGDNGDMLFIALLRQVCTFPFQLSLIEYYKAQSMSNEEQLIDTLCKVFQEIVSYPNTILRPYQSHMRTDR